MSGSVRPPLAVVRERLVEALHHPAAVFDLPPSDLDLTLRLLRRVRMLGSLADRVRSADLFDAHSTIVGDQLLSSLVNAEARKRVGLWELNRIAWALAELPGVPLVALKGCAYVLAKTPNARGRMFADVDLLVPESDLRAVETHLRARGWQAAELSAYDDRYYRRWTHELPPLGHVERQVEVDLHHSILMRTARLKPSSAMLLEASREVPGSRFKVLAPVDMVLHAMVHLFYGGEMEDALRELVDVDMLLRHFGAMEPAFWKCLWPRAEALDLARPTFYALRYASMVLGTPVPNWVLALSQAGAPAAPVVWLMDHLVPRALFPQHPDRPSRLTSAARFLLYVRSHWVKMPPLMLARHLTYKVYAGHLKGTRGGDGGEVRTVIKDSVPSRPGARE